MFDCLAEAGSDVGAVPILENACSLDAGVAAFGKFMRKKTAPTAVICGNDILAAGALGEALRLGINVPGNVSIVGFDNIDLSRPTAPQTTTVHLPHRRMGRAAADLLLTMRKNVTQPESIMFDTESVMRQSLGPASV